jgi:multicomponent K+:H+ antiporter subunit G
VNAVAALLILAAALVALTGAIGLVRMKTFYERVHPPTMAATLGLALTLVASMIHFSTVESGVVLHELLISIFMAVGTPISYMLLVAAVRQRHRS